MPLIPPCAHGGYDHGDRKRDDQSHGVCGQAEHLPPPLFVGIAIDLKSRRAQSGNTVSVNVALPGELACRDIVERAHFLDRNPAAAHSLDHSRLPPHHPSLCWPGQGRNEVEHSGRCNCTTAIKSLRSSVQIVRLIRSIRL